MLAATLRRFITPGLLAVTALTSTMSARADIDPDTFPREISAMEWREVGPFRGGRSAAVAGLPGDRETYYFGSTGGGVWKTRNGGVSWDNVSDGYFGGSMGAVAVSQWDPNIIYAGAARKPCAAMYPPVMASGSLWTLAIAGSGLD